MRPSCLRQIAVEKGPEQAGRGESPVQALLKARGLELRTAEALLPAHTSTLAAELEGLCEHRLGEAPDARESSTAPRISTYVDSACLDAATAQARETGPRAGPCRAGLSEPAALGAAGVQEWFLRLEAEAGPSAHWLAPLTLLAALAARRVEPGRQAVVWVGRRCWPTLYLLESIFGREALATPQGGADRHLFLDPLTDEERTWAIEQALRCPGVAAVVADAGGLSAAGSRRLQLAAEATGGTALLARPPWEQSLASWAAARWSVRPGVEEAGCEASRLTGPAGAHEATMGRDAHVTVSAGPRWVVELLRCKGVRHGARVGGTWVVECEVNRGKGVVHFSAAVGNRAVPASEPARQAGRKSA